ncbi:MAG: hypothetical protein Q4G26_16200 [Paracoccus sp. (in: a-proteobacteria)]|nr:hypothetical protein [Paracoccus sp. (in: a-proteobacteria)]
MKSLLIPMILLLAACGVDGAPERPEPPPGAHISGEARIGIRADGL